MEKKTLSRRIILLLAAAILIPCGIVAWNIFLAFEDGAIYDPKRAALSRTEHYLETAYKNPTSSEIEAVPSCGGTWSGLDCWPLLQEAVTQNSRQYTMTVVYYNWETERPWRGGDEIIVQVDFASGPSVLVFTYESCVEFCRYQPEDWRPPK